MKERERERELKRKRRREWGKEKESEKTEEREIDRERKEREREKYKDRMFVLKDWKHVSNLKDQSWFNVVIWSAARVDRGGGELSERMKGCLYGNVKARVIGGL